jgi:prepilin-type N-terminal cleavage/methylation domain-containing protein
VNIVKRTRSILARSINDEDGFTLIEVMISLFLLALIAAALLPVLVQGLKIAASNATLATATQLANEQIESMRAQKLCSSVVAASTTVVDPRNVSLKVDRTIGASCPAGPTTGYPAAIPVAVSVTRVDTGQSLVSVNTIVFVTGP